MNLFCKCSRLGFLPARHEIKPLKVHAHPQAVKLPLFAQRSTGSKSMRPQKTVSQQTTLLILVFFCKTPSAMLIGKGIEFCKCTSHTLVQKMVGYGDINFLIILLSDVLLGCSLHSIDKLIKQLTYLLNKICFPFTVPRCTCVSRE